MDGYEGCTPKMSRDTPHTWRFWVEGEYDDKDTWNPEFATEFQFPQWNEATMRDGFYANRAVERFMYAKQDAGEPIDGFTQLIVFAEDEVGRRFTVFVSQREIIQYDVSAVAADVIVPEEE